MHSRKEALSFDACAVAWYTSIISQQVVQDVQQLSSRWKMARHVMNTSQAINDHTQNSMPPSLTGIAICGESVRGISIKKNTLQQNTTDAVDETIAGGTAGTNNTWIKNTCLTSTPAGLCAN
jgi:hypothetical protein